jgi:hypothetical protein
MKWSVGMPNGRFLKRSPLVAAAAAAAAAAFLTVPVPALALPPAPLAPGDCGQWQFNGPTTLLRETTTETANFTGSGPHVSAPATWTSNNGPTKQGNVVGDIDPNGHITVTFNFNKGGSVLLAGEVGPNGQASGLSEPNNEVPWHSLAPMACAPAAAAAAGPKEGPSLALDPGIGSLTIHITDHSGVASSCQYSSDFVNRSFKLPANGTADLNVVPAVPLFIDHQVDITCDNGAATHTSAFF